MKTADAIEENRARSVEDSVSVRCVVYDLLKHGGEAYSGEVYEAWSRERGYPDRDRRSGMSIVRRTLRAMEREGEIAGRDVPPSEHRGSQTLRRYYRRAWAEETS